MINIQKANKNHINAIIKLATETWQATYCNIISQEQIDYMLNLFYSQKGIEQQINDAANHFLVAIEKDVLVGYCHCFEKKGHFYISKIYVHHSTQGKGIGQLLLNTLEKQATDLNFSIIELNVNRNNPAKDFYLKNGFIIIETIDIALDKFWLNDYIMQKEI
jgi:ribosomal protein S18 acetylase RimI-like enzyme